VYLAEGESAVQQLDQSVEIPHFGFDASELGA
jgi:hypothetical protein